MATVVKKRGKAKQETAEVKQTSKLVSIIYLVSYMIIIVTGPF